MNYSKINNLFGWVSFLIASITYTLTLEPSASFWDCGEFIACIYRLQVAHQPGAPLFTMIGKIFTLFSFGDVTKVAYWANMTSALASGATILFLFWSITALARKILVGKSEEVGQAQLIQIIGAGLVGALAYAFSDTFWFSAVESEVYAQSSLCTAVVFWAILKWDAHADEPGADKWLVFIAYVMGLSIGIHLLNLLVIPAIACVYYFRKTAKPTAWGTISTFLIGIVILGAILWGIIQFVVKGAAYADLLFVNTFKLGFGSGAGLFLALIIVTITAGILYTLKLSKASLITACAAFLLLLTISAGIIGFIGGAAVLAILEYVVKIREKRVLLNMVLVCTVFILFGYSSFAMLIIRAKAGTNLNNSNPDNAFALLGYLNRDQYGDTPLLYGPYFDSQPVDQKEGQTIYRKGKEKYEIAGKKQITNYDRNTLLPRMYSSRADQVSFYKDWMQLGEGESPTIIQNIGFLFSWQINQMYTRYFLWNFAGRYNDMDGQNNTGLDGGWTSGFFDSGKHLPKTISDSTTYNRLFCLPLILGLLGAIYHFRRRQKDAGIVGLLFFFTGLAIVLYLNQDPLQPRERDYAYAGSFYAFAIWIGLSVLALTDLLSKKLNARTSGMIAGTVCLLAAPVLMASQEWDDHNRSTKTTPRDMAANYLNSCLPNAILFTYGDNDTYPLWYVQEVEGVRPDIRIVNLSLLGTDWYIKQMKTKMNESAPLPITMPDEKFEAGVRDVIYYNDSKIAGSVELKEVFDFITSDDSRAKLEYQSGESSNYLPTKNFKLTVNTEEVIKNGIVSADKRDLIIPELEWKFTANYLTKDNLAMIDVLAHNDWKRPIYFTSTMGAGNMMGLAKYLYNDGFAYRLMPFKVDTANRELETTNTSDMYHNVMTKFKWGNMKNATFLDHESTTMFYPVILKLFLNLSDNLIKEGHPDLAKKVLHKYDEVMPDLNPYMDIAIRKFYLASNAFQLEDIPLGTKITNLTIAYITDQLDFYGSSMGNNNSNVSLREVQLGLTVMNEFLKLTKERNQTELNKKIQGVFNKYESKFGAVLGRGVN
ncbi:MAG: DUF2723 domain-containing protein [Sphingobacteriaceae bacterium]